jgi:hypothetical protein
LAGIEGYRYHRRPGALFNQEGPAGQVYEAIFDPAQGSELVSQGVGRVRRERRRARGSDGLGVLI